MAVRDVNIYHALARWEGYGDHDYRSMGDITVYCLRSHWAK
jgi:hypothetical protein